MKDGSDFESVSCSSNLSVVQSVPVVVTVLSCDHRYSRLRLGWCDILRLDQQFQQPSVSFSRRNSIPRCRSIRTFLIRARVRAIRPVCVLFRLRRLCVVFWMAVFFSFFLLPVPLPLCCAVCENGKAKGLLFYSHFHFMNSFPSERNGILTSGPLPGPVCRERKEKQQQRQEKNPHAQTHCSG